MSWDELVENSLKAFWEKDVCSSVTTEDETILNAHRDLGYLSCSRYPNLMKQGACLSLAANAYMLYLLYKEGEQPGIRATA